MMKEFHQHVGSTTPIQALAYLLKVASQGRRCQFLHLPSCDEQNCGCVSISSINTLLAYKSSLSSGLQQRGIFPNPFESDEVHSGINSVKKLMKANRISEHQAARISDEQVKNTLAELDWDRAYLSSDREIWVLNRNILIVKLMYHLGARISDILNLKWEDVSFKENGNVEICFVNVKNLKLFEPKVNVIAVDKDELNVITDFRNWKKLSNPLGGVAVAIFRAHALHSKVASSSISTKVVAKFIQDKFGPKFTTHSFRVSRACQLKEENVSDDKIAEAIRVNSISMAKRYSKQAVTSFFDKKH